MELYEDECSIKDIMEELQLSRASVYSYIPYKCVLYAPEGSSDASVTADRIRLYRQRRESVIVLKEESTDAALWNAIVAFQDYPFKTVSGLEFKHGAKDIVNSSYASKYEAQIVYAIGVEEPVCVNVECFGT